MTAEPVSSPIDAKARKFPCDGCGADLRWEPGVTAMRCPYCGTEKDLAPSNVKIGERSVDAALRAPRNLGWGLERKVIVCKRCGAHTTLDPLISASSCAFCGTTAVVEAPAGADVVRPEGLLPFAIPRDGAMGSFRSWLGTLWFRPNDLKSSSRVNNMQGVYIPFWTFDAATQSHWTAEAGYYYYVNVQVRENGQMVTKRERRTRWEHAEGDLQKFFDDVPVPASRGIDSDISRGIEPFPTADLTPYDPSFLSGFLAEENAIDLPEALESAKERMRNVLRDACSAEVPGDTQRNLEVETLFSALAYKNALLPIWISAYDYHGKPYRFLVNGVTGKCSGTAPWSWVKITLAVMTALIVLMVVLYAMR
jgi:DNA-directed RNA polymerase subunit RPC12/RpoP